MSENHKQKQRLAECALNDETDLQAIAEQARVLGDKDEAKELIPAADQFRQNLDCEAELQYHRR